MSALRLGLLASLFALGACSATPVPIPFADGGVPSEDAPYSHQVDAGKAKDGEGVTGDGGGGPIPCIDAGDATCGDAAPTDAVLEGPFDGGTDVIQEAGPPTEAGFDSCCAPDLAQGDTRGPDL